MDVLTASIILGLLGSVLPFAVGVGCCVAWRRSLFRPGVFLLVAVLAMFGLSGFFHWVVSTLLLLGIAFNNTLVADTANSAASLLWTEIYKASIVAVLTASSGVVLLRALMRSQVKP